MVLGAVLERFAQQSPVTVLAKILLDRALDPSWIDEIFETHRKRQYTRELLFSTTIELMSTVVLGLQPSIHAAAQSAKDLSVSLTALYGKIKNTEPHLVRELVRGSAKRLAEVCNELQSAQEPLLPGYKVRIVDGNHLPASEKRLEVLRSFRGGARPGYSLVVYEPDLGLVTDILPCEDAFAHERTLMPFLLDQAKPGEMWIADRNFSTSAILRGFATKGACFLVREHGASPHPNEGGRARKVERIEAGTIYEQQVELAATNDEDALVLRRIELRLKEPMENGESVIRILTNAPASLRATELAALYRRRWTIESMFQWLESVLNSEVRTLGYPRAALLAFGSAVLAFNALRVIARATEIEHEMVPDDPAGVSLYYVAVEVRTTMNGLCIAVDEKEWEPFREMTTRQFVRIVRRLAGNIDVKKLRKHPRGPKVLKKKGFVAGKIARSQVSTARVVAQGKLKP